MNSFSLLLPSHSVQAGCGFSFLTHRTGPKVSAVPHGRGRRPCGELLVIRGNQAVATPRDFTWTEVPSSCNRVTGSSQSSPWCSDPSGVGRQDVLSLCLCSHRYDAGRDGFIDLMELKLMMEKLGAPQTHLGLKNMIKEVDEDFDSKLSFREVSPLPVGGSRLP